MKLRLLLILLCWSTLGMPASPLFAQYNPAADNPYIQVGNGESKKWYEFYKKEPSSPYVTKNAGYWYNTRRENGLVRGVKTLAGGIKEILKSALQ